MSDINVSRESAWRGVAMIVLWCGCTLVPRGSAAADAGQQQPASAVSEADIERIRRNLPDVSEQDIAKAIDEHGRLPEIGPEPQLPRRGISVEKLPRPRTSQMADIGKVAEGFAATAPTIVRGDAAQLVVFASFSMPDASWIRVLDQAEKIGATVMLRGLEQGSLRKTVGHLHRLQAGRAVNVQIDPKAFERYQIRSVPAVVLTRNRLGAECANKSCVGRETFTQITGDVSIDFALERMIERHPHFARDAAHLLTRLRKAP